MTSYGINIKTWFLPQYVCSMSCLCCCAHLFWFLQEILSHTQLQNVRPCYCQYIIHYQSSFTPNVIKSESFSPKSLNCTTQFLSEFTKSTFSALSFTPVRRDRRRLPKCSACVSHQCTFYDSKLKSYYEGAIFQVNWHYFYSKPSKKI